MCSFLKDNIWGEDLAGMQLISEYNKGNNFFHVLLMFLVNMYGLLLLKR